MKQVNRTELQVSEDDVVMLINDDQFIKERIRVEVDIMRDTKRHGVLLTRPRAKFRYSRLVDGRLNAVQANKVLQNKVRRLYEDSYLFGKINVFCILIVKPT